MIPSVSPCCPWWSPLVALWNIFRKIQDLFRLRFRVGIVHLGRPRQKCHGHVTHRGSIRWFFFMNRNLKLWISLWLQVPCQHVTLRCRDLILTKGVDLENAYLPHTMPMTQNLRKTNLQNPNPQNGTCSYAITDAREGKGLIWLLWHHVASFELVGLPSQNNGTTNTNCWPLAKT